MYCCPLSFFPHVGHSLAFALSVYLLGFVCWKPLEKRTRSVYRAHGISIILGIFQHSLILIGLAAIVSRSQAHQQLVMPSGGNMSITTRVALFRRRGGGICKLTLKIQSGDNWISRSSASSCCFQGPWTIAFPSIYQCRWTEDISNFPWLLCFTQTAQLTWSGCYIP